jgi:hypothetical protein
VNAERRARYIERVALRAARRALRKSGKETLTREELLALRIQRVPPWKRACLVGFGLLFIVPAVVIFSNGGSVVISCALGAIGGGFAGVGLVGHRTTVESCLAELGGGLAEATLEIIYNVLSHL